MHGKENVHANLLGRGLVPVRQSCWQRIAPATRCWQKGQPHFETLRGIPIEHKGDMSDSME